MARTKAKPSSRASDKTKKTGARAKAGKTPKGKVTKAKTAASKAAAKKPQAPKPKKAKTRTSKTAPARSQSPQNGNSKANMRPLLPPDYRPRASEPFMNELQREYFRQKLLRWKDGILRESVETLQHLQEESLQEPDIADRASLETDRALELRTRDRQRKLIAKIDAALQRIEDGTYGYCEETNEPISLKRLEARPIATLSIEAQERHERLERTYRDE